MSEYKFRSGNRITGCNAQKVGEALEEIRQKNGGIQTDVVIRKAKAKSSPLHNAFEWNDAKAAHQHRLDTARYLIRAIQVIKKDGEEPAFVHVKIDSSGYYQSTEIACRNIDEWDLVYQQARDYLQAASDSFEKLMKVNTRVNKGQTRQLTSARKKLATLVGEFETLQ